MLEYLLIIGPFMALSMWAAWRVQSTFAQMHEQPAFSGLTGAEVAREMLDRAGLMRVQVVPADGGHLSDHYDPTDKMVRLSPEVYGGRSLSSLGVAAHEVGHALQDAQRYPFLTLRNGLVPFAQLGGGLSMFVIIGGSMLMAAGALLGPTVLLIGIGLFALTVVFQVVNLPVEFDASRRARQMLVADGFISPQEDAGVGRVLNAAALTYVAATLTGIATLLYYLLPLLMGRQSEE